ncbi:MAG TPA: hypothetical protein VJP59_03385 [Gemmatimonadota bacterium]|nr:hypothetical protein [Gemmatimonadota bacterium]
MSDDRTMVPAEAMKAALEAAQERGIGIEWAVVSVQLIDHAPCSMVFPQMGEEMLQAIAQLLGLVSKAAGAEVTVVPIPTTGRGQG